MEIGSVEERAFKVKGNRTGSVGMGIGSVGKGVLKCRVRPGD